MIQHVSAIYENGMFKPLGPVSSFAESELVELTIAKKPTQLDPVPDGIKHRVVRPALLDMEIIPVTMEEIWAITAKIPQTAVEMIREDREARAGRFL